MFLRIAVILGLLVGTTCPVTASPCGKREEQPSSCTAAPKKPVAKASCCAADQPEPAVASCCSGKAVSLCEPEPEAEQENGCCNVCPCCAPGSPDIPLPPVTKPLQRSVDTLVQIGAQFAPAVQPQTVDDARVASVEMLPGYSTHNQRQAVIAVWRD